MESTLTTPHDRTSEKIELKSTAPPLSDEQANEAIKELNQTSFVERFPQLERRYQDPPIDLQQIGLISFVPSKNAKPDEKGVFGFAKLRGNFKNSEEANSKAEDLIRNVDSYHQIFHAYVGRPFPITNSSDYSKEVTKVDLQQQISQAYKEDLKNKREKEQKEIQEIKDREKELLEDVDKKEEDVEDKYTSLKVKKAQLSWTYSENMKKLNLMKGYIAKARKELEDLDKKHPEMKELYMKKYTDARKRAGLPVDKDVLEGSFMKYMVEDLVLPEVDEEYERLYGKK